MMLELANVYARHVLPRFQIAHLGTRDILRIATKSSQRLAAQTHTHKLTR